MPRRRLAEKAVERFGLLQVHGFPAPTHVPLPLELAPPKGGERPAALRPRNGDSASWQRQRNAPRCRRLLVAGAAVRDLLLRAKHLFVAATEGGPVPIFPIPGPLAATLRPYRMAGGDSRGTRWCVFV
jgi:hypothetical protein